MPRTISNIIPSWWCVATPFLSSSWLWVVWMPRAVIRSGLEDFVQTEHAAIASQPAPRFISSSQIHQQREPNQDALRFTNPFRIKLPSCCAEAPERHLHVSYLSHHQSLIWALLRDFTCWIEFYSLTTPPPPAISTLPHRIKMEEKYDYQPKIQPLRLGIFFALDNHRRLLIWTKINPRC